MIVDRYTKIVLTIIAASLVVLVAQNSVSYVGAADGRIAKVQICNAAGQCAGVTDGAALLVYKF